MTARSSQGVASHVKVAVPLHDSAFPTEWIWANPLGEGLFVVDNVPFFARDLNYLDVIAARVTGGRLEFVRVVKDGGHRTVLFTFERTLDRELVEGLKALGCTFEGGPGFLVVDVPQTIDRVAVSALIDAKASAGLIDEVSYPDDWS